MPRRQIWLTCPFQWEFLIAYKKEGAERARFLYVLGYSATRNCGKFAFAAISVPVTRLDPV